VDPRYRVWVLLMVERHGYVGARELTGLRLRELVELVLDAEREIIVPCTPPEDSATIRIRRSGGH